jgi:hypothetical protein
LTWEAQQFHWHQGSEHTIDDERFDLEIHTVHYPDGSLTGDDAGDGTFIAAALGIIFSVDNYSKDVKKSEVEAIDAFFDSYFEDMDTTVTDLTIESPEILYGSLIQALNTKNR